MSGKEARCSNQFGTTILIWCGKHHYVRQGLPHYATNGAAVDPIAIEITHCFTAFAISSKPYSVTSHVN